MAQLNGRMDRCYLLDMDGEIESTDVERLVDHASLHTPARKEPLKDFGGFVEIRQHYV